MALVSPGVEVTVIDESQYIPSAVNTVPYFIIATAQNKADAAGVGVAAGTTAANANKTYLITSQRDLAATFGVPFFYNTTTGTPINGYELNEYGLLAAYSALGVTNRAFIQRVDIDLTELTASLSRPTGNANNGTYWLDTSTTTWGIFEWNQTTSTFTNKVPIVITDAADVEDSTADQDDYLNWAPLQTIGSIGDYAVSAVSLNNLTYYKNSDNDWVFLGTDEWKNSWPTVQGTNSVSGALTGGLEIRINDQSVTTGQGGTALTVAGFATAITNAAIPGVTADAVSNKLTIYADSAATNDGSTDNGGVVSIEAGTGGAGLLTTLGITAGEYRAPSYFPGYSYQSPRWSTGQLDPAPTGSIWQNISSAGNGMSVKVKVYSAALDTFVPQTTNVYVNDVAALYALDPVGGGKNIPVGTTYLGYNNLAYETAEPNASFLLLERAVLGQTIVTGSTTPGSNGNSLFTIGNEFTVGTTEAGSSTANGPYTVTLTATSVAGFITAVSAANIPYVSASVNSAGNIVFTHSQGGSIALFNTTGTPVTTAGFVADYTLASSSWTTFCRPDPGTTPGVVLLSNWVTVPTFTYTASDTAPDQDPANGRLWYYSDVADVDIMIQNNGAWVGYQNVSNDTRGFNLTDTNASGPIVAATAPTTQNDVAESPLEYGDLWIDSSDLENYPLLYRWEPVSGVDQWVAVDTTDQTSSNGILFADARWAPNGTTDPVADPFPTIVSLLTSNYLDLDAPDPALYPEGMLLFNTRRSGYNVKSFQNNYFNSTTFPDDTLPTVKSTWLTASGNKDNGAMYAGRQAQRKLVVAAMKSGIDTSLAAREEQNQFNLIAAPAYPELATNMVALSNERSNTLFVLGDTPMRLAANGTDLLTYATNNGGLGLPTDDGLTIGSAYAAVFYPSCQTTDLSGNTVVTAPTHMMVRTILRSDAVSYPWLAPAGTRRGVIDNAEAIGFIDAATGEFVQTAVGQGIRDVLYENNINPITFIPGVGITNFGNKTRQATTTALDRINVARLIVFLRGRLEEIGKQYLFEPNDQITRNEISNTINSLMIDLIAKRAIYDYLVVCDLSNNTPARIDRNELYVDVAIEPVKAVEFIYIPLRIKNTGEISGVAA
jgi:phage tail sheath protein FI